RGRRAGGGRPPGGVPLPGGGVRMRTAIVAAALTVGWIALWGDPTLGNAAGGAVVAVGVLAATRSIRPPAGRGLSVAGTARFVAARSWALVTSSLRVAALVLSPRRAPRPFVVTVRVPDATPGSVLAASSAIGLTPGTLVVDTVADGDDVVLLV